MEKLTVQLALNKVALPLIHMSNRNYFSGRYEPQHSVDSKGSALLQEGAIAKQQRSTLYRLEGFSLFVGMGINLKTLKSHQLGPASSLLAKI